METFLLFIIVVLLWIDLDEDDLCPRCSAEESQSRTTASRSRQAAFEVKRLTDQAVLRMLDEARRYEPGPRR